MQIRTPAIGVRKQNLIVLKRISNPRDKEHEITHQFLNNVIVAKILSTNFTRIVTMEITGSWL